MKLKILIYLCIFINWIYGIEISMTSNPINAIIGEQLTIKCSIKDFDYNSLVFFKCPNNNDFLYCLKNCETICQSSIIHCDSNTNKMVDYQCNKILNNNILEYEYKIIISKDIFKDFKDLKYTCNYLSESKTLTIPIIEKKPNPITTTTTSTTKTTTIKSTPKRKIITTTTIKPNIDKVVTYHPSTKLTSLQTTTNYSFDIFGGNMRLKKLWLLGLLIALGISIILNLFCCIFSIVNCCTLKNKKQEYIQQKSSFNLQANTSRAHLDSMDDSQFMLEPNTLQTEAQYLRNTRRVQSQPTLSSNASPHLLPPPPHLLPMHPINPSINGSIASRNTMRTQLIFNPIYGGGGGPYQFAQVSQPGYTDIHSCVLDSMSVPRQEFFSVQGQPLPYQPSLTQQSINNNNNNNIEPDTSSQIIKNGTYMHIPNNNDAN